MQRTVSHRHVLVTTDFSPASEPALAAAESVARDFSARVTLLHVLDPGSLAPPMADAVEPRERAWRDEAESRLQVLAKRFLEAVPHSTQSIEALTVSDGIRDFADQNDVDLVVIATHGRTGVRRLLLGSVTERVLQEAPCSVLAVRSGVDGAPLARLHEILVPTDFSEGSRLALDSAVELATRHRSGIDLLHSYAEEIPIDLGTTAGMAVALSAQIIEQARAHARQLLESEQSRVQARGVPVRIHLSADAPDRAIVEAAQELRASLIVMGTHGRKGFRRWIAGSVCKAVVRAAGCSVMMVKPRDSASSGA